MSLCFVNADILSYLVNELKGVERGGIQGVLSVSSLAVCMSLSLLPIV